MKLINRWRRRGACLGYLILDLCISLESGGFCPMHAVSRLDSRQHVLFSSAAIGLFLYYVLWVSSRPWSGIGRAVVGPASSEVSIGLDDKVIRGGPGRYPTRGDYLSPQLRTLPQPCRCCRCTVCGLSSTPVVQLRGLTSGCGMQCNRSTRPIVMLSCQARSRSHKFDLHVPVFLPLSISCPIPCE